MPLARELKSVGVFVKVPVPDPRQYNPNPPRVSFLENVPVTSPWGAASEPPESYSSMAEDFMRVADAVSIHRAGLGLDPAWLPYNLVDPAVARPSILQRCAWWITEAWNTHTHTEGGTATSTGAGLLAPAASLEIGDTAARLDVAGAAHLTGYLEVEGRSALHAAFLYTGEGSSIGSRLNSSDDATGFAFALMHNWVTDKYDLYAWTTEDSVTPWEEQVIPGDSFYLPNAVTESDEHKILATCLLVDGEYQAKILVDGVELYDEVLDPQTMLPFTPGEATVVAISSWNYEGETSLLKVDAVAYPSSGAWVGVEGGWLTSQGSDGGTVSWSEDGAAGLLASPLELPEVSEDGEEITVDTTEIVTFNDDVINGQVYELTGEAVSGLKTWLASFRKKVEAHLG